MVISRNITDEPTTCSFLIIRPHYKHDHQLIYISFFIFFLFILRAFEANFRKENQLQNDENIYAYKN